MGRGADLGGRSAPTSDTEEAIRPPVVRRLAGQWLIPVRVGGVGLQHLASGQQFWEPGYYWFVMQAAYLPWLRGEEEAGRAWVVVELDERGRPVRGEDDRWVVRMGPGSPVEVEPEEPPKRRRSRRVVQWGRTRF
jgi:hypothetical protein